MYIWQKQYSPPPDCSVCELLLHHVPVGGEDGESDDDDYHDFNSSDDGDDDDDDDDENDNEDDLEEGLNPFVSE